MNPEAASGDRSACRSFGLVLAFSAPFYLLGLTGAPLPGPLALPITVAMIIVPMLVVLALVWRDRGLWPA